MNEEAGGTQLASSSAVKLPELSTDLVQGLVLGFSQTPHCEPQNQKLHLTHWLAHSHIIIHQESEGERQSHIPSLSMCQQHH